MDSRLSASMGCYHVTGTTAVVGSWFGFVPDQDTVVSGLSGATGISTVNWLTAMNLGGHLIKQGSYFSVPEGSLITAITLTSGAVVMYTNTSPLPQTSTNILNNQ